MVRLRQGSLHESFNLGNALRGAKNKKKKNPLYLFVRTMAMAMEHQSQELHIQRNWKLGLGYEMPCGPVDGMDSGYSGQGNVVKLLIAPGLGGWSNFSG